MKPLSAGSSTYSNIRKNWRGSSHLLTTVRQMYGGKNRRDGLGDMSGLIGNKSGVVENKSGCSGTRRVCSGTSRVCSGTRRVCSGDTSGLLGDTSGLLGKKSGLLGDTSGLLGNSRVCLGTRRVCSGTSRVCSGTSRICLETRRLCSERGEVTTRVCVPGIELFEAGLSSLCLFTATRVLPGGNRGGPPEEDCDGHWEERQTQDRAQADSGEGG